jgi:hypothetical protein
MMRACRRTKSRSRTLGKGKIRPDISRPSHNPPKPCFGCRASIQALISDSRQPIALSVILTGRGNLFFLIKRHRVVRLSPVRWRTSESRRMRSLVL